jgi:ribonuclease Y
MEIERLEALSGLSADEAKDRLAQTLKEEAQTSAAAFINEVMEEAKMTANKEAKKDCHTIYPTIGNGNCN